MSGSKSKVPRGINVELPESALDMVALGIAKTDGDGRLTYANREVLRMTGLDTFEGRTVADIFQGEDLETVRAGLKSRFDSRAGGAYEVDVLHRDGHVVPVSITAYPATDGLGMVIGTMAIIRDLTIECAQKRIYDALQEKKAGEEMLQAIASEIRKLVPFDQLAIFRLNRERTHLRNIFTLAPEGEPELKYRWWLVPPAIMPLLDCSEMLHFPDLRKWYGEQPERRPLLKDRAVKDFLDKGYVSCLSYPVLRKGARMASIGLYRKGFHPFTPAEQAALEALPLSDAVSMAMRNESETNLTFLIGLMKDIATAYGSVGEVAQTIVERIAAHYQWDDVSIFQVFEHRREIRLIAQCSSHESFRIKAGKPLPIDKGILGKVFETKEAELIGDVGASPFRKDGIPRVSRQKSHSQMCLPIGKKSLWLLNIEDRQRNAFASEEKVDLEAITTELSALLDRTLQFRYRSAIFNRANDAIFLTSYSGEIIEVNDAGEKLFRQPRSVLLKRPIADLVVDPLIAKAILKADNFANQEVAIRCGARNRPFVSDGVEPEWDAPNEIKVLLSAATLPEDIDGRVFIATDMSLSRRLDQLEVAKDLYMEVASQVKTPMSLATAWLRRFSQHKEGLLDEFAAKILQQLQKVELTLDRMMLYEKSSHALARAEAQVELRSLIEGVMAEMPDAERQLIQAQFGSDRALVLADPYQIRFCLQTILSYLIRLVPEDDGVRLDVVRNRGRIEIRLSGKGEDFDNDLAQAARHGQVQTEMSLCNETLQSLVEANGGLLSRTVSRDHQQIEFRMRFPASRATEVLS